MRPRHAVVLPLAVLALSCGDGGSEGGTRTIDGVEVERAGPFEHVLADLDYPRPAPSGGSHPPSPFWLTCGVYEGEVPDELAVHSLEHGAVWIALGPDSTEADRATATDLAAGRKVIVSEVPDLVNAVELVAWEHRLAPDGIDDPRVEQFLGAFIDAPTAREAGSSCASVGEPPVAPELPSL